MAGPESDSPTAAILLESIPSRNFSALRPLCPGRADKIRPPRLQLAVVPELHVMTKPDYTDFYRFIASLGLVLVGLGPVLYWVFLHDSIDAQLTVETISSLSPEAQEIVANRYSTLLMFLPTLPYVACALVALGSFLLLLGSVLWYGRQQVVDEKEDIDLKKARQELVAMSPAEREAKTAKNVPPSEGMESVRAAEFVERRLIERYREASDYEVLPYRKLNDYEYDILLVSKSGNLPPKIIEVRYFRAQLEDGWIRESFVQTYQALWAYRFDVDLSASGILVLVASDIQQVLPSPDQLVSELDLAKYARDVRFVLVKESDVDDVDLGTLLASAESKGAGVDRPATSVRESTALSRKPSFIQTLMSYLKTLGSRAAQHVLPTEQEDGLRSIAAALFICAAIILLILVINTRVVPGIICPSPSFCIN